MTYYESILENINNCRNDKDAVLRTIQQTDENKFNDFEWNEVLSAAGKTAGMSVEELLEELEDRDFTDKMADEAEEYLNTIAGAEDPVYGCDPYPMY